MDSLQITLFGQLHVRYNAKTLSNLKSRQVRELFAYLLLHRGQQHHREILAGIIWENTSQTQSKNYLRKTIWQLQSALNELDPSLSKRALQVTDEWIGIRPDAGIELDVAQFEDAFAQTQGIPAIEIEPSSMQAIADAVQLYQGNLLEGWYQDWCLFERERLQQIYFVMLDKLMDCCEAHQQWERGLMYGSLILRHDIARERTHRRMMRLYYLAQDRTAALRQFDRCREALQTELGVAPSRRTLSLYREIRGDQLDAHSPDAKQGPELLPPTLLVDLEELNNTLLSVRNQVDHQIQLIEALINGSHHQATRPLPTASRHQQGEPRFHSGPC
jgi:DNA-binding SARP family transcriptional activator